MANVPDPARRNPQSTAAILRAALQLAQEEGWSKVSIEGIAARAGVGKRTIYRWWPSKGAVVLDAYAQRLQASPEMSAHREPGGDARTDLIRIVKGTWIDTVGDTAPLVAALIGEAQHDKDVATRLWDQIIAPSSQRVIARIKAAQTDGEITTDVDPYRATELIYGQIYVRLLFTPQDLDAAFLADCVDLALNGLKSR